MRIKQLSVFLENKSGRLAKISRVLGEEQINILALSLADTADFGILRMLVDDPDRAAEVLKEHQFVCIINTVTVVEVDDKPGGLAKVVSVLDDSGINVEYMYAFSSVKTHRAALIFRFEDNAAAIEALQDAGFSVLRKVDVLGE